MADCEAPSDLLRVTLAGFVVPSHIRPGFSRTWGISVVSDMWAPYDEAISDIHASIITKPPCSWSSSDITCEVLDGQRLRLEVALDAPTTPALTFELVLEAKVHCGRVVLPLHLGPVAVVASLNALEIGRACIGIGAGRQVMGEALSLGSGVLLHKKVGDPLRQGDVLLTLFAEVGGSEGPSGTRRVIDQSAVDAACARILEAYGFSKGAADAHKPSQLIRCFIDRDGSVKRL